ncbi:MAG TPA: ATP-binding protein [Bryobacteraceae bacterium]|jgi:signal transduction histidine kinase|nr:ATP-binding protein [Bryobacteraceae bacterium]
MPIRQKLVLIGMATTTVALILAGIGIIFADFLLFRGYLRNDLSALTRIIADNTTAALSFDDPAVASEALASLHARTHVVTACVFQVSGKLFAKYTRAGATAACPAPQLGERIRFDEGVLIVSRPILLNNRRLGTLVLVYDLGEIYERVQLYGATVITVFLLSTFVAFLLSSRLRSLIATPIIELARVTTRVSKSRNYGIRAQKFSGDELGVLVDAFNEMLSGIQSRDNELREALMTREAALEDTQKARQSLEATVASVAQLNAELRTSNDNLARSNEDLERFAFIASHDLQEPLRMITIYSQLLIRRFANVVEPQAAAYIENIESGTERMRALLADLLAYAEIGARVDAPAQPVDLNLVVRKVRENLSLAITESGAVITVAPLPVIRGLKSHFTPLFQNLIGNAIKYRGELPPKIDIGATRMDGDIQIHISDNGIGVAPEYHSRIFVAFKRLHTNKIPGTGIGLAICQRVVERYGGRIWVESDLGQGSNFVFTLPANLVATANGEQT